MKTPEQREALAEQLSDDGEIMMRAMIDVMRERGCASPRAYWSEVTRRLATRGYGVDWVRETVAHLKHLGLIGYGPS